MVSDIALIVTAIGVLGVMFGLRQTYRERLRNFEAMYIERYWKILDQLSLDALRASDPSQIRATDEKAVRSYMFLCEDELEMRQHGYVADDTYKVWADSMRDQLSQPIFAEIWKQVEEEAKTHRTFPYEHLRHLLGSADSHLGDPLSMSPLRRRLRGLAGLRGV